MKLSIQLLAAVFLTLSFELQTLTCVATTTDQQAKQLLSKQNEKGLIENQGQMMDMEGNPVPFVLFKTEAPGVNLWITEQGMTMQTLQIRKEPLTGKDLEEWEAAGGELSGRKKTKKFIDWERIDLTLKGASIKKENIIKEKVMQGHTNYFYPHCPDGIYGVKEYQKVTIQNVYPNIDWVIYRTPEHYFKYDFVVHPGGDYHQIELVYHSKTPVLINEQGQLTFTTNYGNLQENKPVSFYEDKEVETKFTQNYQRTTIIHGDKGFETSIGFQFPKTSNLQPQTSNLVIDPQLVWGTLYGGNNHDGFKSIDTDNMDNIFIAGYTYSNNFPTQNVGTFFQGTYGGGWDAVILKFDNIGNHLWATYYGGSGDDVGNSITTDSSNNIWITGYTSSSADFSTMYAGAFFQGTFGGGTSDAFILKFDNTGNRLWATYYGGSGTDFGNSITTDGLNNVWITGSTGSPLNFPTQNTGTFFQVISGGTNSNDAFILKFGNSTNRLWATYYGGGSNDEGISITTDSFNNVWISGWTSSNNFPTQNAGTFFQGIRAGGNDIFILKFDNIGNRLWATLYGGNGEDKGCSMAIDSYNNIWLTGSTSSSSFPTQNSGTFFQGTKAGMDDAFILKFDNTGNRLWATYYGGSADDKILYDNAYDRIVIDNCNNVYICFDTWSINHNTFSPDACHYQESAFNQSSVFGGDIFLVQFNNSGSLLWSTYIGGDNKDFRGALAIDQNNNLFISGEFANYTSSITLPIFNFGNGTYFDSIPNGADDSYILKFESIPPSFNQFQTNASSCSPCGGIAVAEITCGTPPYSFLWNTGNTTLNTFNLSDTLPNLCAGNYWVEIQSNCAVDTLFYTISQSTCNLIATFSSSTTIICQGDSINFTDNSIGTITSWNWTFNGGTPTSATTQGSHTVTFTTPGIFNTTLQISDGVSIDDTTIVITVLPTATSIDTIVSCTPITWIDGNTYSATTNTPTFTITGGAANGCDSIVTLNLTINTFVSGTDVITSCTPITWIDGNTYSATTNTPTFTITGGAANGCDSIVTLDLTINTFATGTDVITSCIPITWIDGNTYSATTNTPTFTITGGATNGCDSIVTLDLTINTFVTGTDVITSCTPITWIDGNTYSATTNTPTFTITGGAANGCDSIVTLDLTINTFVTGTDVITSCTPITWIDGNTYSATTNTPTFTIVGGATNGCDSIVTLNFTITPPTSTTQTFNECEGFNVTVGANSYSTTGTFIDVLNGCDTVITNLTINPVPQLTLIKTDDNCDEQTGSVTAIASSNNPPITYNWNTGSIDSTINNLPSGLYSIIVADNNNCTNTDSVLVMNITTNCEPAIFIPNVFSPNGDNHNDLFMVQLVGLEFENLQIYNRWGVLLFETKSSNEGWDGRTTAGEIAANGTYFYILNYKDKDEKQIKKGTLTLLR